MDADEVLRDWLTGRISEGLAARRLEVDRLTAREMLIAFGASHPEELQEAIDRDTAPPVAWEQMENSGVSWFCYDCMRVTRHSREFHGNPDSYTSNCLVCGKSTRTERVGGRLCSVNDPHPATFDEVADFTEEQYFFLSKPPGGTRQPYLPPPPLPFGVLDAPKWERSRALWPIEPGAYLPPSIEAIKAPKPRDGAEEEGATE